jgi:signal peptidase II
MISLDNTNIKQKNERPKYFAFVFSFIALILFDQIAKYFAHNIFRNSNFAFSLPLPAWLMYLIYTAVLAAMVYYISKHNRNFSLAVKIAWTLIFAGAVANITERIVLGYVKDFIYITFLKWTGVYNLADFFIIFGVITLVAAHQNDKN